jgi:hypothetical protein
MGESIVLDNIFIIDCIDNKYITFDIKSSEDRIGTRGNPIFKMDYHHENNFTLTDILTENGVDVHNIIILDDFIDEIHKSLKMIHYDIDVDYPVNRPRLFTFAICEQKNNRYKVTDIETKHFINKSNHICYYQYKSVRSDLYEKFKLVFKDMEVDFCKRSIMGTLSPEQWRQIVIALEDLGIFCVSRTLEHKD